MMHPVWLALPFTRDGEESLGSIAMMETVTIGAFSKVSG
jgi:hypothetical protein